MKITLLTLVMFQSTSTLVAYMINKNHLLEAGVLSTICVIAYVVGEMVLRKDFKKEDVKVGLILGVFMGLLAQICQYYWIEQAGFINIGLIIVCLFPKQVFGMILKVIKQKTDKL
ncbi:hypothetical protein N9H19_00815 [Flavobacteriales bacterium]|nr:hypothetical protein [Flavobacteriales bacterium]